jgi:hypothetical protein
MKRIEAKYGKNATEALILDGETNEMIASKTLRDGCRWNRILGIGKYVYGYVSVEGGSPNPKTFSQTPRIGDRMVIADGRYEIAYSVNQITCIDLNFDRTTDSDLQQLLDREKIEVA